MGVCMPGDVKASTHCCQHPVKAKTCPRKYILKTERVILVCGRAERGNSYYV